MSQYIGPWSSNSVDHSRYPNGHLRLTILRADVSSISALRTNFRRCRPNALDARILHIDCRSCSRAARRRPFRVRRHPIQRLSRMPALHRARRACRARQSCRDPRLTTKLDLIERKGERAPSSATSRRWKRATQRRHEIRARLTKPRRLPPCERALHCIYSSLVLRWFVRRTPPFLAARRKFVVAWPVELRGHRHETIALPRSRTSSSSFCNYSEHLARLQGTLPRVSAFYIVLSDRE